MEVADLNWRKASYSNGGANACIEVASTDTVLVRDSKDRTGPVLRFSPAAWRRFADQMKRSLADLLPGLEGHFRVLKVPLRRVRGRFPGASLRSAGCGAG